MEALSVDLPTRTASTLAGYRMWRVQGGELCALVGEAQQWRPGVTVDAHCDDGGEMVPHVAPARGCHCGAHAVDSLATLRRHRWRLDTWAWGSQVVIGSVLLWGAPGRPVIVGELRDGRGYQYRAPHGRVLALLDTGRRSRRLARRLGLEVLSERGLEMHAAEFGGMQLRPLARPAGPTARESGSTGRPLRWLAWASGRRARSRAPWAWTLAMAAAVTLLAAGALTAMALRVALLWIWTRVLPRLGRLALVALLHPIRAVMTVVALAALLVTPFAYLGWWLHPGS